VAAGLAVVLLAASLGEAVTVNIYFHMLFR
jgi:hypothetical protein